MKYTLKYTLLYIICACVSGILYRMGGSDKFNPKWRDWGVATIQLLVLYVLLGNYNNFLMYFVIPYFLAFLLSWGALSAYWKTGEDMKWYHWFMHGFGIGLAFLPIMFLGYNCYLIILRAFILGATMMIWSENTTNVVKEEVGRGALIILTLPILSM